MNVCVAVIVLSNVCVKVTHLNHFYNQLVSQVELRHFSGKND